MPTPITVACMLWSGGEFLPRHVHALRRGVARHWPQDRPLDFVCITDRPLGLYGVREIPLVHDWPGWWPKVEMYRPDIPGDVLYMDLDTVVIGDMSDIAGLDRLTLPSDWYQPQKLFAGFMFVPEAERREVWAAFNEDPVGIMGRYRSDQEYLWTLWLDRAQRMQDELPGQVVSYKVHVRPTEEVPEGARVVCYHGQPRPWETELWAA